MRVSLVMFHVLPYKPGAIRKLEPSLHTYRQHSDVKGVKGQSDRN